MSMNFAIFTLLIFSSFCDAMDRQITFESIPLPVQGKIVKKIFQLVLQSDKCSKDCRDHFQCKTFRMNNCNSQEMQKCVFHSIPIILGKKYVNDFLCNIHSRDNLFPLSIQEIYSASANQRTILLKKPSFLLIEGNCTQQEYELIKDLTFLKGKEVVIIPNNRCFELLEKSEMVSVLATWGSLIFVSGLSVVHSDHAGLFFGSFAGAFGGVGWFIVSRLAKAAFHRFGNHPELWRLQRITL